MATYGLLPPTAGFGASGIVQFTGYTNTLGVTAANQAATSGVVYRNGIQQGDDRLAKMFRNGGFTVFTSELLFNLIGAVPGTNTTRQSFHVRGGPVQVTGGGTIPGTGSENISGLIVIDANPLGNRVTTASDANAFKALVHRAVQPATYAVDVSGNGGGGKAGR